MSSRRLQQSTISFSRSKQGVNHKGSSQTSSDDLLLDCPICSEAIPKSTIEEHVEKCIALHGADAVSSPIKKRPASMISPSPTRSDDTSSKSQSATSAVKQSPSAKRKVRNERQPLAERMRPSDFNDLFGNTDLLGPGAVIRTLLEHDPPPSTILFGPPGCGKTSVATVISQHTRCPFRSLSCSTAGVQDIRTTAEQAENEYRLRHVPTILFMDEIHRFNKKQQDVFLPYVETGKLVLIGATTENPSFSINSVIAITPYHIGIPLKADDIIHILNRALTKDEYLHASGAQFPDEVIRFIAEQSDGDARMALNLMDACASCVLRSESKTITPQMVTSSLSQRFVRYDKHGEEHYNIASALQKSIRGSDVQGAVYWLARMIEGGEDPLFIARRLLVIASEDVGLADPHALLIASACYQACNDIGLPECVLALAECSVYLALTSKSNEVALAYGRVRDLVRTGENPPVPLHIRNAPIESMEDLGYGVGYQYGYNKNQTYLPKQYIDKKFIDIGRAVTDLRTMSLEKRVKVENELIVCSKDYLI